MAKVEVLLDAMPFVFLQLAAAEKIDRRACSNCDICDDKARMMSGQVVVDGVRKYPEFIVEEVDKNENNADEDTKLTAGSYLGSFSIWVTSVSSLGSVLRFALS